MAEPMVATDNAGRKIVLRELDPGDMLDLLEAAGAASTNQGYMRYAMVIASLEMIDETPVPVARTREQMRANAKRLGNDGFSAAADLLFGSSGSSAGAPLDDVGEVAKN